MTAVDMAKLNRPGVMSSYSSSGRKNTVHGSKSTVVGSTFNQARMTAATKFLSPSKGGHVSARIMAENSAPRYLSGSETAIIANRDSGQVTSLQSGTSIFGFSAGMMMPSMPMGGMSTGGVLGFLAGTAGAAILKVTDLTLNIETIIGVFVSFIVGIFSIKFLLNYIKKHDFSVFAIYRVVFAIIILIKYFAF